jgi:hypothetical protein
VLGWVRIRSPATDLPALARLGIADDNVKTVLENPRFVASTLVGERVARVIDLEAPMDLLFAEGGLPNATVAFRPSQASASPELDRKELAAGRFLLEKGNSKGQLQRCELWQSASSGERIVCATDEERIAASAGFFLTRAESSPKSASFRAEILGKLLREGMQKSMKERGSDGGPDSAAGRFGKSWVESIVAGMDSMSAEVDIGKSHIDAALEFTFEGSGTAENLASWFAPERARAVPDAFFELPGDSELAFAFAGVEHQSGEGAARAFLRGAFEAFAEDVEVSESERNDLENVSFAVLPDDGRFVLALGHDLERSRDLAERVESAENRGKKPSAQDLARLDEALAGWALVGVEADASRYLESLRRAVEVYQRPAPSKKKSGTPGAPGSSDDTSPTRIHLRAVAKPPPDLPKGSFHAVNEVRPNPDYRPPADGSKPIPLSHDTHIVAVPDGAVVWISLARDEKVARARARAQLGKNRGGPGAFAELRGRFGKRTVATATMTLGGIAAVELDGETPASRSEASIVLARLGVLPNRGRTTIPTWVDVTRGGAGDAWSVTMSGTVPLPALVDIVKWFRSSESVVGERQ